MVSPSSLQPRSNRSRIAIDHRPASTGCAPAHASGRRMTGPDMPCVTARQLGYLQVTAPDPAGSPPSDSPRPTRPIGSVATAAIAAVATPTNSASEGRHDLPRTRKGLHAQHVRILGPHDDITRKQYTPQDGSADVASPQTWPRRRGPENQFSPHPNSHTIRNRPVTNCSAFDGVLVQTWIDPGEVDPGDPNGPIHGHLPLMAR